MLWAIRIISGDQAGQIFPLKPGQNTVGRGSSCIVKINSFSVSKEHCSVLVTDDKVIITDMNSRNGTFVNGVRVQNQRLNIGDKIVLHDVLLDVLKVPEGMQQSRPIATAGQPVYAAPPPSWAGNAALNVQPYSQAPGPVGHPAEMQAAYADPMHHHSAPPTGDEVPQAQASANSLAGLFYNFKLYIDNVAMPGVYHIAKSMPYQYAIALLLGLYVVIVTALSTIPVATTTRENIRLESKRRALTIARNLAATNRQAVIEGREFQMSTRAAELEEGITLAIIINSKDGTVIAPASKRGEFVNKAFVNKARREDRELTEEIGDSSIGVSVPISRYSSESGAPEIIAHSIVLYDLGALAMNSSQTLRLFIESLGIGFLVALLLYFFLYKVIEHPLKVLNVGLDDALREGRDDIRTDYQYPALERLISNINSALSRIGQVSSDGQPSFIVNRDVEAANTIRMLTSPAMAVSAIDDRVVGTNAAFDRLVGGGVQLQGRPLTDIPDVALQQNLQELLTKMRNSAGEIALNEIPFPDAKYEICGQVVMGSSEPAYFVIVLNRMET